MKRYLIAGLLVCVPLGITIWLLHFLLTSLLLILLVGKNHIFWRTTGEFPVPEKAQYFNPTFLIVRDVVIFGLMTWLSIKYVASSVRLDVGRDKVKRMLRELEQAGYLVRSLSHDADGRWVWESTFSPIPAADVFPVDGESVDGSPGNGRAVDGRSADGGA